MHSEQRKNESSILPSEKNMGLLLKIGGMEDYLKIGKWYSCNQKACGVGGGGICCRKVQIGEKCRFNKT